MNSILKENDKQDLTDEVKSLITVFEFEKTEQSNNNTLKNNIINSDLSNTDL